MQALFEGSEEAPGLAGLGIFPGFVERFPPTARVPHMGWNSLTGIRSSRLMRGLGANPYVYFAHSYYVPETPVTAATCEYALPYTAVLEQGNIYGVQFHPEKSGPVGLQIVRNFIEI
jgi:imidazole glycerol phosphate synthase glutamine amidotransferase subunit